MLAPFLIFFRRLECQCNDNMLVKRLKIIVHSDDRVMPSSEA